jgi:hypothetical protein
VGASGLGGERVKKDLPTALPTDQAMKFIETAKDFLVWPATFLVVVLVKALTDCK